MRSMICVLADRFSRRVWVDATQLTKSTHVVGKVLHPDLCFGPHQADGAHEGAAHVAGLRAEDVFDHCLAVHALACTRRADPHGGFGPVAALGLFGQRLAPLALAVDMAFQFAVAQLSTAKQK